MWNKLSRRNRLLIATCALALLVLGAVVTVWLLIPYGNAKNTMDPDGTLILTTLEDGSVQLSWPEGDNATGYRVQVRDGDGKEFYSSSVTGCSALLPQLPAGREVEVRVTSTRDYSGRTRRGSKALAAVVTQPAPVIEALHWQADDSQDVVEVAFDMSAGDLCRVYLTTDDGAPVPVEELHDGKLQLRFGVDDVFPVPEYGQQLRVSFQLERNSANACYRGPVTEGFTLTREDFLGRNLQVEQTGGENNSYTVTWNETKGEYYDVRLSEDGGRTWMTLGYIPADRDRRFTTPCLKAFADYLVQVVAVGGDTLPDSNVAAESEVMELHTAQKLLYSTIWPLMDRKVYTSPDASEELGEIPAGSAWCVLGQQGQYLKLRYNGQEAWVDSEYCMINLTEYLGNLCAYDITNSYDSLYLVHEYGIRDVSGTVIEGYEHVRVGEGEYLVPLLYPAARRLLQAGLAARERGYRLKIYDSFRPQCATSSIYAKTSSILGWGIPDQTFSGKKARNLSWLIGSGEGEDTVLTYGRLMTNYGAFSLGNFLAPGTSRHNFGVAVDLTLEDAEGKELAMQTSMHDLSWYSVLELNNGNAKLLNEIMTGAGFRSLFSEWWHFQDAEIYSRNLYKPLVKGVSWECWVADHNGWRYRLADGSFYANCTAVIEEESYAFDENGYLVQ